MTESGLYARMGIVHEDGFRLDIEISIAGGETVALLGPNGAGKSTAVAAVAGLQPLHNGRIALGGVIVDDPANRVLVPAEQRRVGVVFQDYLLFPHLNVLENVAFGLRSRGVDRSEAMTKARGWLQRVGLESLGKRRPSDLSGGQAQRVALARALVTEPDVLLLDEPLAALDVTNRSEMRHVLGEHLDSYFGPKLLITHEPSEAFLLADRVYVIEDGAITQMGTPDDIRIHPRTSYAADLADANLIAGVASMGVVETPGQMIHVADRSLTGRVLLTIRPNAIVLHADKPAGSPRNSWPTRVDRVESLGDRVRVRTGPPLSLIAEVTREAADELGLTPGAAIWVAFKATEIGVEPDRA